MQQTHLSFKAGQAVVVRDQPWLVLGAERFPSVHLLHLRGTGDSNRGQRRTLISPFDVVRPLALSTRLRRSTRQSALAAAAAAIADAGPWNSCRTAASAAIDLHAWQLEPAMAAVMGATRILLADHVGLGKTIQASLIVSELCARGLAERVLVLTPACLRDQWAAEMGGRFRLQPTIFDHASLASTISALPAGINPWHTASLIVSSIDLVKRPEVRTALDGAPFDILVVDEAHHLTPGTDRAHAVADLASRTPWVVLATATPHSGDEAAFRFLCRLGAPGDEPPLTFRRLIRPSDGESGRRSRIVHVTPTPAERLLLNGIRQYVHAIARGKRGGEGAALVASVIARRASSSAEAVRRTLLRRRALLVREPVQPAAPLLPWEDGDASDGGVDDVALAAAGLSDRQREIEWLQQLAVLAAAAAVESSKIRFVRKLLRRTSEPLLVFSEYRDVVELVAAAIADLSSVTTLHGGLSPRERRAVIHAFTTGRVRTLVATDAAGEGLNFHQRCRFVVNIELPWMPRRLEQRIGRVDRLGQRRRVHAVHLVHRESFEGTVVARLERRRSAAEARTQSATPNQSVTLAAVERQLRVAITRHHGVDQPGGAYSPTPRRAAAPIGVVLIFAVPLADDSGRLVHRAVVAVEVDRRRHRRLQRLTRSQVRRLLADPTVQSVIGREIDEQRARTLTLTRLSAAALELRLASCLAYVRRRRNAFVWQGSLFDRQAESDAQAQHDALADLEAHLARRQADVRRLAALHAATPRPVAAWLAR